MSIKRSAPKAAPVATSVLLLLAACGGGGGDVTAAQDAVPPAETQTGEVEQAPAAAPAAPAEDAAGAPAAPSPGAAEAPATAGEAPAAAENPAAAGSADGPAAPSGAAAETGPSGADTTAKKSASKQASGKASVTKTAATKSGAATRAGATGTEVRSNEDATAKAANERIAAEKGGNTDVGVTKTDIKLGSINMHGMALGNVLTAPQVRGNQAAAMAINDRGGILGRRMSIIDCDDGPGEVSRAKACIKKLAGQDKIFGLLTGVDWATASIHDDLKHYKLPYVGAWAYSQTEWQDPYMFPTHMSMIHEAMAGANWVRDVIKPKTYGMVCLTSPEMQLACGQVERILNASGAKMVKKVDVGISETSMSAQILAMRAAAPDHIIHYVINPATMAKFMVEAAQQAYYPPQGVSGNHLAAEVLGSLFGKHPENRYWTNTTYKLWGPEFMATMAKYARGNKGTNHHIVQAGYVAVNILAEAAKEVGPNLTRERLMAVLGNGTVWKADATLDQKFQYTPAERGQTGWSRTNGQGREFMYKYTGVNTVGDDDGSPQGFRPDPDKFVIYTH
jgi:hypothetical protein